MINEEKEFKAIICGSTDFDNYDLLKEKCDSFLSSRLEKGEKIIIYTGSMAGAETLGERYAKEKGFGLKLVSTNWKKYGSNAGKYRSNHFTDEANACLAFIVDGEKDTGTSIMLGYAKKKHLLVREFNDKKEGTAV